MFNFTGLNVEKIKLRLGALVGRVFNYHKEEHNEKTLNLELQKTEIAETQIGQQQYIAQQINISLPEGLSIEDQRQLFKAAVSEGGQPTVPQITSPEPSAASGGTQFPTSSARTAAADFLTRRVVEYKENKDLLLDKGGLLFVWWFQTFNATSSLNTSSGFR